MLKKNLCIAVVFLVLVVITTYPLVFNINKYLPAYFSTDESFAIPWTSWFNKFSLSNHLSFFRTDYISYPFGIELYNFTALIWTALIYILSILTTPALTYNLQIVFNLFFTGYSTYLLVLYLAKNRAAALLSGVIFGFCPYMFVRSWQHIGETYLWPMPVFLLLLFILLNRNDFKIKALFVLTFIFAAINFDVTFYICVILLVFFVYMFFKLRKRAAYFMNIIFLIFISFLLLLPQFLPVFVKILNPPSKVPSPFNPFLRSFGDLFEYSAKPLSYFLPSVTHPVFGKFTEQFIGSALYGISFTEHTLYLGWIPILLAAVAFYRWKKSRKTQSAQGQDNLYIGFFVFLTIAAWFFSQPPWWKIGPLKVYMPSFFIYKMLPPFRAYCRFGVVLMLAVSVLSGFGLKFIMERFKNKGIKLGIVILACILVLFEFWNYPPFKVIDISKAPEVYYWLKDQPSDTVIAEYPLDIESPSEMYRLYQITHEKKMINYTIPGQKAHEVALTMAKLSDPLTILKLKDLGVKLVLVHRELYLDTGLISDQEELKKIAVNPGLKFVRSFFAQDCADNDSMCIQKTGQIDVYGLVS